MDSKGVFSAALNDLGLDSLGAKLTEYGWATFGNFAFATSDPTGKDASLFEKEVIKDILPEDGSLKSLIPKLRRLYAQSFIAATASLNDSANPGGDKQKVSMHLADRQARSEALRERISVFKVQGQNLPSQTLIDKRATMLQQKIVKYIPWDRCTSREQEVLEEPEVKGLRLTTDGLLLQDVAPDARTDFSGEILWDCALRRRAVAAEISGMMPCSVMDAWHETMKSDFLAFSPPGYRRVSWPQLQNADQALWRLVGADCENGTGVRPGEQRSEFEKCWVNRVFDIDVRTHLQFLPSGGLAGSGASSSGGKNAENRKQDSELQRLTNRLAHAENQLCATKRKLEGDGIGGGISKGSGKGKMRRSARANVARQPHAFGDLPVSTPLVSVSVSRSISRVAHMPRTEFRASRANMYALVALGRIL